MSSYTSSKQEKVANLAATSHQTEPPQYYNSEPSSQPPEYPQASTKKPARLSNPSGGASAANVAAILAYPSTSQLQEDAEKRSWRERWREWKARNSDPEVGGGMQVSGPTLNVQGVGVKSWTSITPMGARKSK